MSIPAALGCTISRLVPLLSLDGSLISSSPYLHRLTSASPVATGLEISSTGSKPPSKRSHENRGHAPHRARRHHQRHGLSCCLTSHQLRSPCRAPQVSALGDVPSGSSDAPQQWGGLEASPESLGKLDAMRR